MTTEDRDEFGPDELDRLHALYNGCDAEGGPAGIGVQARDRLIRRLIEQLKRERARPDEDRDRVTR
jgi:hypothetical protein